MARIHISPQIVVFFPCKGNKYLHFKALSEWNEKQTLYGFGGFFGKVLGWNEYDL